MAKARMTDLSDFLGAKRGPEPEPAIDAAPAAKAVEIAARRQAKDSASKASSERAKAPKSSGASRPKAVAIPEAASRDDVPRYLTFIRKESRITQAQADQLSSIVRTLNMARRGEGERITDNTLIRVAIGLLLDRVDELHGATEVELFQSLGLNPME